MQQGWDAELLVGLELTVVVGREVDHRQEGVGVYIVVLARLHDCLITKTKADAETAQHLQQVVIIADERDHLVVRLIHLLILHLPNFFNFSNFSNFFNFSNYLIMIIGCKGRHYFRYVQ